MTPNDRVLKAIEELKKGNMIVMVDDEDRENEGDLVYACTFTDTKKVNFMISEARGILCTALNKQIAKRLDLTPMVANNSSSHETAFTISVDAREATTGVSADERDMTIRLLADYSTKPYDLVRPGHIFPLIAKEGGVLVRTGHTEGSVDLCRLAGLSEVAAICEIVKEDGTMARRPDLDLFCQKHNLHMVYISDIVEYRIAHESLVRVVAEQKVDFMGQKARKYEILDHKDMHHIAYKFGNIDENCAVKFHTIRSDYELLSSQENYNELLKSISYLQENNGIMVFLDSNENNNMLMKEFGVGAQILRYLGVKNIQLLTKNTNREYIGLGGFGLKVVEQIHV
ncbi:MAG: bifunctional 3,4-dihydroxy-2-butanone 4-phosphate synthase/GTP cyclohydrolase II [Proteobacteria bacterium]|nr:MAG: bifunctional 3,4-dihydroxy-2-butanone 4-phosphate synthase/GTP cyclohydrolase II [Pseudomonadota bacterium]